MPNCDVKEIMIDGAKFIRADLAPQPPTGKRCVLVLDRGWIVAGDVEDTDEGRIVVSRAIHVLSWSEIGFSGMVADPKSTKVRLKPMPQGFDCPGDAELFRVHVPDNWGL